tara:strand:+ start:474 stop:869 length:396 start_codon:yes stop_codon:yes gene_type:complete
MSDDLVQKMLELLTPSQKQELAASLLEEGEKEETKGRGQDGQNVVDDFTMKESKTGAKPTKMKMVNTFVDDGTEHKDRQNETPEVEPTERKRGPTNKVEQSCQSCSAKVKVHPLHSREFFVCDKCLRSKAV